jgi:hypothetical protein
MIVSLFWLESTSITSEPYKKHASLIGMDLVYITEKCTWAEHIIQLFHHIGWPHASHKLQKFLFKITKMKKRKYIMTKSNKIETTNSVRRIESPEHR